MKKDAVVAVIEANGRTFQADFRFGSGRLLITEAGSILEDMSPPDSWMALAVVNGESAWGTRPAQADIAAYLQRYVAERLARSAVPLRSVP